MSQVEINIENDSLRTSGLIPVIGREVRIPVLGRTVEEYTRVLNYLIEYVLGGDIKILPNQTIGFHSWALKFLEFNEFEFELWEARMDGEGYIRGVDYALEVVTSQERECKKHSASPLFPTFAQLIVISKGVYEGLPVEAVRFPSPNNMTGWWLTTDLYDDNIKSLQLVHYYHVGFKRPDLLRYLSLPFGFRFLKGTSVDVWFDEKALEEY